MLHGILIPLVVGIRIFANSFLNVFQKRLIAAVPNALEINFVMYLLLSLGMLPFAPAFPFGTLPPEFWFWAALVGIAGSCGNACMVKALERGELSVLGPVNAWQPVVAMIGGILVGLIEIFVKLFAPGWYEAVTYGTLIVILLVKPAGILGKNTGEKV